MTETAEHSGIYAFHPLSNLGTVLLPNLEDIGSFIEGQNNPANIATSTGTLLMLLGDITDTLHLVRVDAIKGKAPTTCFMYPEADEDNPVRLKLFNPATAGKLDLTVEDFFSFKLGNGYFHLLENIASDQHLLQILHHKPNWEGGPLFEEDDIIAFFTQESTTEPTLHLYTLDSYDNGATTQLLPTRFVEDDPADLPETTTALQATS